MFLFLFITVIVLVVVLIELPRKRLSERVRHLPGPTEYPLIGSKYALFPNKITDIVALSDEVCAAPIAKLFLGPRLLLIISSPEAFEIVLNHKSCLERPYLFEFIHMEYGLTASKYSFWKPLRKGLNVAFGKLVVNDLIPMFDNYFREMIKDMEPLTNGPVFDVKQYTYKALFHSICHTILEEVVDEGFSEEDMEELEDIICQRLLNGFMHMNFIYKKTQLYKREMQIRNNMEKVLRNILEKKKTGLKIDNLSDTKQFVERLLLMKIHGERLNDSQILDNMVNLVIGGFETSASTLAYTVLSLAMYPEVQKKAQLEVDTVFPDNDKIEFSQENLKRLTYIDCVINETLRLFPPIPFSARENTEDIKIDKTIVPERTIIGLNIFQLHRSEKIWGKNSKCFDPERFRMKNVLKRHSYSFLPFTAGSRNCIGNRYGLTAIKIGIVHLLKNFEFNTPLQIEDLKFKFSITLKLLNAHFVQIRRRNQIEKFTSQP